MENTTKKRAGFVTFWLWLGIVANIITPIVSVINYQGYKKCEVILVFDAYKVKGNPGSVEKYKNIHIVYTKEAETADAYIQSLAAQIGINYTVRVAS